MKSIYAIGAFIVGILITLIVLALSGVFSDGTSVIGGEVEKKTTHLVVSVEGASEITCTYPQILHASYMNNEVRHALPKAETNPMIFTFSDFSGDVGKLKYIDSTRTISETPLLKMSDTSEKLVFIEGSGNSYITTHTIYKNNGVSIYSKEVDIFGIPSGSLAMGTCVGI